MRGAGLGPFCHCQNNKKQHTWACQVKGGPAWELCSVTVKPSALSRVGPGTWPSDLSSSDPLCPSASFYSLVAFIHSFFSRCACAPLFALDFTSNFYLYRRNFSILTQLSYARSPASVQTSEIFFLFFFHYYATAKNSSHSWKGSVCD